jgi:hypothetical protein
MNAERKRHMRPPAAPTARTIVNAREADHGGSNVAVTAGIEERRARSAAGAPVFGDAVVGRKAEMLVEFPIAELA